MEIEFHQNWAYTIDLIHLCDVPSDTFYFRGTGDKRLSKSKQTHS